MQSRQKQREREKKKNLICLAFGLRADAKLAASTEVNSALLENKKQHFQEESLSGRGGQQSHTLSLPLFENAVQAGGGGKQHICLSFL